MQATMCGVMLGLAVVGNPDLLSKAVGPTIVPGWTIVDLGGGSYAFKNGDLAGVMNKDRIIATDGVNSTVVTVEEIENGIRLTDPSGIQLDVTLQQNGEINTILVQSGELSAQVDTWTEDEEVHGQVITQELGPLGLFLFGVGLAGGLFLVLCLGLGTFCWNAIQGTLPRRTVWAPFICPVGLQCEF